jgi:Spy/CpxP family protein refolding chaperone
MKTMKNLKIKVRTLVLAATVLVVPFAMAQEGRMQKDGDGRSRIERMGQELGLSAEQMQRMEAIRAQHAEKNKAIAAMEDQEQRRADMNASRKAQQEAMQAVLTPEQREKAKAMRAERTNEERDPAARAEARTEWMTKELGLSAEQAEKIKAIHLQHMQKMQEIKGMENEDARKRAMGEMRKSQHAAVQAVLTPAQQERMEELKAERKAKYEKRKADGHHQGKGSDGMKGEWKEK